MGMTLTEAETNNNEEMPYPVFCVESKPQFHQVWVRELMSPGSDSEISGTEEAAVNLPWP